MVQVVEVQVNSARDGEKASGVVAVERKEGNDWKREKSWDVQSAEPGAYRKIAIGDDQRIVIEAKPNTREEYDREQAVVRQVPVEPPEPAEEAAAKNPTTSTSEPVRRPSQPFPASGAREAPRGR